MTIRIMLVGLVASLGIELPKGTDVSSWARAGSDWVQARMLDRSGPEVEVKLDLAGASDCQQAGDLIAVSGLAKVAEVASDAAFEAASRAMIADLSADLLATSLEGSPVDELAPVLALEGPAPAGPPDGDAVGCLAPAADEVDVVAAEVDEVEVVDEPRERLDRVSAAVRLTREAVQAWAAVLQQSDDDSQPSR